MDILQNQLESVLQEAQQHARGIEEYAKNHINDAPENVERELNQRLLNFRNRVNDQLSAIEKSVLKNAPKQNEPDYENKKARYKEFLSGASNGLKTMSEMLGNVLTKLGEAICQIVKWLVENLPTIVPAIVTLFEKVIFPLLKLRQK